MKVQKLNESIQYEEAENPGRGACCPTVPDYSEWIDDALAHVNDEEYTKPATNQLIYCAKILLDTKQSIENFNIYWQQRYEAMIAFIDSQVDKIPTNILSSLNDIIDEDLASKIRKGQLTHIYHDEVNDTFQDEEDGLTAQIQDIERHTHEFGTTTNQWGKSFIGDRLNKHPKVATQSLGRIWKDGKFDKSFEGPKYQVRAEMAKYLDSKR